MTPSRPVVSLPLATEFNEAVAVDLKEWKPNIYFLHLVDLDLVLLLLSERKLLGDN